MPLSGMRPLRPLPQRCLGLPMSVAREAEGAGPQLTGPIVPAAARGRSLRLRRAPKLAAPKTSQPLRVAWIDAIGLAACHLLALLAFVPWLFSWTGVDRRIRRAVCVRHARHQPVLSSAVDPSRRSSARNGSSTRSPYSVCAAFRTRRRAGSPSIGSITSMPTSSRIPTVRWFISCGRISGWLIVRNRDTTRLRIVSRYAKDILQRSVLRPA